MVPGFGSVCRAGDAGLVCAVGLHSDPAGGAEAVGMVCSYALEWYCPHRLLDTCDDKRGEVKLESGVHSGSEYYL